MVGINDRDPRYHDLYLIDITTGARRPIQRASHEIPYFLLDDHFRVRLAARLVPRGAKEVLRATDNENWDPLIRISSEDQETTRPVGFDGLGSTVYMRDSRGRATAALTTSTWSREKKGSLPETTELTLVSSSSTRDTRLSKLFPLPTIASAGKLWTTRWNRTSNTLARSRMGICGS